MVEWLIFLHVLGAITFFFAHGASAAMVFRLRHETELPRIKAVLDMSSSTLSVLFVSFLVMGISGLIMPFMLGLWGEIWIWASIVLIFYVAYYMSVFNRKTYNVVRKMAGMPFMENNKPVEPVPAAGIDEINAFIQTIPTRGIVVVGYMIPAFVLWLMVFKPF